MAELERILKGTPGTLQQQWYEDGAAVDPGTVTVGITRADGTTLVAAGTATAGSGTSARGYSLTTTHTALLDTFTVTWTSTGKGALTSTVEVVGGFVFTIADARAYSGLGAKLNDGTTYKISTAALVTARTEVERALEHELDFAMVPRYSRTTLDGNGRNIVAIKPHPRVIRTATVAGTALVPSDLAMTPTGLLYNPTGWTSGWQNVVIGYEHGRDYPPARAKDVALALTRRAVAGTPADDRATSVSTEQETTTFYVPGGSEPFDIPAANRFVAANTLRTGVA